MSAEIFKKIRQLYRALGVTRDELMDDSPVTVVESEQYLAMYADFTNQLPPEELENQKTLLVSLIGSLKDHLKVWCRKNGVPFEGDQLIDTNFNVGLIHDLWNIDKHCELDRAPRSGISPKIVDLKTTLVMQTGEAAGSRVQAQINPRTGRLTWTADNGGSVTLRLVGRIEDEHGTFVAGFVETCEAALTEWEALMKKSGVALP